METNYIDGVLTIRFDKVAIGWQQYILLVSDQHHDSPFCDRKLEKAHLDEAMDRDALIFMGGDTFDAMQSRKDPRANYDHLEPFLKRDNYFDAIIEYCAEFYKPYAKNIVMIGVGNHEADVLKHHNISLIDRLAAELNRAGGRVHAGGYGGWVRFFLVAHKTHRSSFVMRYFHGYGGESPVTKGVIQTNRQATYLPDVDIVWNGHNHQQYIVAQPRERLSDRNKLYRDVLWFIRTPGYNDEWGRGENGWAVNSGLSPKPMGCAWLKLSMEANEFHINAEQDIR